MFLKCPSSLRKPRGHTHTHIPPLERTACSSTWREALSLAHRWALQGKDPPSLPSTTPQHRSAQKAGTQEVAVERKDEAVTLGLRVPCYKTHIFISMNLKP